MGDPRIEDDNGYRTKDGQNGHIPLVGRTLQEDNPSVGRTLQDGHTVSVGSALQNGHLPSSSDMSPCSLSGFGAGTLPEDWTVYHQTTEPDDNAANRALLDKPLKGRLTAALAITATVSAIGGSFPHGWNTGVLNAPQKLIIEFLNTSYTARVGQPPSEGMLNFIWPLSVAIYLAGGCAGALCLGWMANKFGRKRAIIINNGFSILAALMFGLCKLANSFEMLIIARFIVGFGCGAGSGLVPMYLTEISPVNIRGAMGVIHQFTLTCGILLSQAMGMRQVLGSETLWPLLLAFTGVPCIISCIVLPFLPESPRYLYVNKNNAEEARKALQRFRGTKDVQADMEEMQFEVEQQKTDPPWSFKHLFHSKRLRLPLIIVCALSLAQQLSGINVVFYYSVSVFEISGIPPDMTQYAVLGTGIINVIMTAISVPLMEKSGRRPLLLGGMALMWICALLITIALNVQHLVKWMSYLNIVCIIGFVIGFAIGLGSIPQFIGAELFKQGPRPPAMSIAGLLNWLANFLVAIGFPPMESVLKAYSFIVFIGTLTFFGAFIAWKLPETKNKSYEEIYRHFSHGRSPRDPKIDVDSIRRNNTTESIEMEEKQPLDRTSQA